MDIPYGFDCFAFSADEVKYFASNLRAAHSAGVVGALKRDHAHSRGPLDPASGRPLGGYVRFTRKNEDYSPEQLGALAGAGRLNASELGKGKQVFCGIKIQIGIGVITNFLHKGLQYRKPIRGRSELVNGTWQGIVSGLTVAPDAPTSYDVAIGNFLAYDEEFPYMKFGPFFAIESKLVMLTGGSRRIEASSFGANVQWQIYAAILSLMVLLSLFASLRLYWDSFEQPTLMEEKVQPVRQPASLLDRVVHQPRRALLDKMQEFFFIYFTMLLNKPSVEFDELIWPRHHWPADARRRRRRHHQGGRRSLLPSSLRALSYLWSAACLVMASMYSGEMLAVILLHADENIDTITQLIHSEPPIEPVIRQDDFTYNLMLKSLDANMLLLHNMTKIIPRPEVYTRRFIKAVAERKQALLGDDELIETIYDIYKQHFPLYRSKVTYLQYPISIMYRMDLDARLEAALRKGMVQIFEMGLIHRWYQAQKDTYIQFYDSYENRQEEPGGAQASANLDSHYRSLSMHHFVSFFRLMLLCILFAFLVLLAEILHFRLALKSQPVAPGRRPTRDHLDLRYAGWPHRHYPYPYA